MATLCEDLSLSVVFKTIKQHQQDVSLIQEKLKTHSSQVSFFFKKSPSNSLRDATYKHRTSSLNISSLKNIIHIDLDHLFILVEPNVTIRSLCKATLQYSLIPFVVPEFTSITVGGAIMGAALESSSHRYGQFNDNCLEYELLLGNADLVYASPENHAELFYGISGSYGTLALLTLVKLRLRKAKSHVLLHYRREQSPVSILTSFGKPDFLEGVILSPNQTCVIEGTMISPSSSERSLPRFHQRYPWSPWFYQHIADVCQHPSYQELMPLQDYLFRFDRGAFWMGRFLLSLPLMIQVLFHYKIPEIQKKLKEQALQLTPTANPSFFFRLLFGWALSSRHLYSIWHHVPNALSENCFCIHDFYIPLAQLEKVCSFLNQKIDMFPLWLCPLKGTKTPQILSPHYGEDAFVNIGFYGIPPTQQPLCSFSALLENTLASFGSKKMLYSFTYYEKEIFDKIYNQKPYSLLRKKFHADNIFLDLYNKISRKP